MENNNFIPAPLKKRFFAFYIDVFVVYLIRFFYINFSIQFWLKRYFLEFLKNYELLFGKLNFAKLTNIEISYFAKSQLFSQIIYFIIGIFLIPIIYNMIFFFTKWSATIGQKIMNICVISKNGNKMNFIQIILRSFVLMIPWILSFFVVIFQILSSRNLIPSMTNGTVILFLLIFLGWYDIAFITKNKLVFHDYITKTRTVIKNNKKYENEKSLLDILFIDSFKKFKNNIKNQIEKVKDLKEKYKKSK